MSKTNSLSINEDMQIARYMFTSFIAECSENSTFKHIIDSGNFIFINGYFVINDIRYVTRNEQGELCLTEYAQGNLFSCCLLIESEYRTLFMNLPIKSAPLFPKPRSKDQPQTTVFEKLIQRLLGIKQGSERLDSVSLQAINDGAVSHNTSIFERSEELKKLCEDLMESIIFTQESKQTFSQMAWSLMENRKCTFTDDFTKKTLLSVKTYNRIKSGELVNPKFDTAMAVCIGLNLGVTYAIPLLKSAGYDLEQSSAPLHKVYHILLCTFHDRNIYEWNEILAVLGFPQIKGESAHKTHENSDMK